MLYTFSFHKYCDLIRLILIVGLACGTMVSAQTSIVKFRSITIEDGLSNNTVYAIAKDRYGFIWFATSDGLSHAIFAAPPKPVKVADAK